MCECGCSGNDDRYMFPALGDGCFYLLTLSAACPSCDSPSGVSIELIDKSNVLYKDYKRGDFVNGKLRFEKWVDTKGIAIITGFRRHEFVRALSKHLVGTKWDQLTDREGKLDDIAAEVVLEEMYEDSLVRPHFLKAKGGDV